ncbi:MAG: hypothetical protein ACLP1X_18350 [Polyangiaceae bacterium]
MSRAVALLLAVGLALALSSCRVEAFVSDVCRGSRNGQPHEFCFANGPASAAGRYVAAGAMP